jgi:chemotaxis protein methyltransferase CheR
VMIPETGSELERVADIVRRTSGVVVGAPQLPALAAAIARAEPGLGAGGLLLELGDRTRGPALLDRLVDEVTVKETCFLRHRSELETLDWRGLLEVARRRGSPVIRVWSAACASGEEAYSLAMLAGQAFAPVPPPVAVLGTDIAASALRRAAHGRYGARSLRNVEEPLRERYFHADPDGLVVSQTLRELVTFARHNLVGDPIPPVGRGPFELIVCRNVLIYFDRDTVDQITAGLERALAPGGRLVLGAADRVSGKPRVLRRAAAAAPPRPAPRAGARDRGRPASRDVALAVPEPGVEPALAAAETGRIDEAIAATDAMLAADALDPVPHFIRGLAEHAAGDPEAAAASLRRAVYLDPGFLRAAFELGRAHDALNHDAAAARCYRQALDVLHEGRPGVRRLLNPREAGDIAAASRGRLRALGAARTGPAA